MNYQDLKQEIKAIADIADGVPEMFRARCFELLLQHLLDSYTPKRVGNKPPPVGEGLMEEDKGTPKIKDAPDGPSIPTPSQVKVFMQKTGVTSDDLQRIVIFEDDEVHFVQEPTMKKIARGQIEWSLLVALKDGVATSNFSVDPESVRSICQEKGFYDKANFIKNFKTPKKVRAFSGANGSTG